MSQLVGKNCAHCGGRITNELDSRFCAGCKQPVHDGCVRPAEGVRCEMCGAAFFPEPESLPEAAPVRPKPPPDPIGWRGRLTLIGTFLGVCYGLYRGLMEVATKQMVQTEGLDYALGAVTACVLLYGLIGRVGAGLCEGAIRLGRRLTRRTIP